jgi:hypothetical protein
MGNQHGRGGHWALVVRRRVSDNSFFGLCFGCSGRIVLRAVSVTSTQVEEVDYLLNAP